MYFNGTYNVYRSKSRQSTCQSTKQSFPLTVTFRNLNKFLALTSYIHNEESSLKSDSSLDRRLTNLQLLRKHETSFFVFINSRQWTLQEGDGSIPTNTS